MEKNELLCLMAAILSRGDIGCFSRNESDIDKSISDAKKIYNKIIFTHNKKK